MIRGLFVALALVLSPWLAAAAQDFVNVTVNVNYQNAEGRVLINGVPIHRFAAGAPEEGSSAPTDFISTAHWMRNGDNHVVVEGRTTAADGFVVVTMITSLDAPPLAEGRIEGEGTVEATVQMSDLPPWLFLTTDPWTGDEAAVLGAVAALHAAMAAKDYATVDATGRAMEEDMSVVWGPMPEEIRTQFHDFIGTYGPDPLAGDLTVESFFDGRLWVVSKPDGAPPIRIANPADGNERIETGQYWIYRDGGWSVVR